MNEDFCIVVTTAVKVKTEIGDDVDYLIYQGMENLVNVNGEKNSYLKEQGS